MQNLPIHDVITELQLALNKHKRVVLQAPPGAGKTTAVPLALLQQSWLQNKQIIMLEPRRIAARNAAARMASLLNEKVGETVGYQIRQDHCYSKNTRILVVTEGILTRKLQADPELTNIALVIFDEFHERSLNADLSLALCLQSQQIIREDLKVLVMSATLNTSAISQLLRSDITDQVPLIQSEGRSYPVEIHYSPLETTKNKNVNSHQQQLLTHLVNTAKHVIETLDGNCLIFLPGVREINQLTSKLKQTLQSQAIENIIITPLHGSLTKQQQDQAIVSPPKGIRKIVLATNIAETSLTIEGISCVIDSGKERIMDYSPASGMNQLKTQTISQDSAQQRCGRAGRLSAGVCYRLWSEQQHKRLQKHSIAEILHSDLSPLMLELANWGVQNTNELQWMDSPPSSAVSEARSLLEKLSAIDNSNRIKTHGKNILNLGTHPRLAHMMLSAIYIKQTYHACLIASVLTEKSIFLTNADKSYDIHDTLKVLHQFTDNRHNENLHNIDIQQCKRIMQSANEFHSRIKTSVDKKLTDTLIDNQQHIDFNLSGVLLAYAYPDRIAKQRNKNQASYLLSNGKGAIIPQHLQHHVHEFLVVANLDAKQSETRIYLAAEINHQQLDQYFSELIHTEEIIQWNDSLHRVDCMQITSLGKIVLQEMRIANGNKQAVQSCLLQAIKKSGLQQLNWSDKARMLQQRLAFINYNIKTNQQLADLNQKPPLPDFSDETLNSTLEHWLLAHLTNETSLKQCQKLDLHNILLSQLSWDQQQLINKLAPEKIAVPSGSNISVDYSDPAQAILAVRLQEVFGLYDTPTLLDGHSKVMMHLLSPARRPMQVTQDLNSFWKTTYHEVKKELRGKYKRHYWPDDPFTAQATSKTKKNMNK